MIVLMSMTTNHADGTQFYALINKEETKYICLDDILNDKIKFYNADSYQYWIINYEDIPESYKCDKIRQAIDMF